MGIDIVTLGCRLNTYESEAMQGQAEAAGQRALAIVNTCAVTAEAARQARQAIRRLARDDPGRPIVVTGCAAQVDPQAFAAMPEVARVIGNAAKTKRETWAEDFSSPAAGKILVSDIMAEAEPGFLRVGAIRGHTRAFVPVQNGCDHRCTFCIIPFGRGNSRSVPLRAVVEQVETLVANGTREVVLTGVDITSYGRDLADMPSLGRLVRTILREVSGLARLRLSSIDSVEADRDLLAALAEEERLMPHLHLSLQAGDDLVLKRMKRRHKRADAIRFCADMRRVRPDVVFGADFIAGFPTESEAMFGRTLDLVGECGLTHLHVFPFSARPGTPAARMPAVPDGEVKDRARRLREAGRVALQSHLAAEVGATRRILTEAGQVGRTDTFTLVKLARPTAAGTMIDLAISGHDGRALLAA